MIYNHLNFIIKSTDKICGFTVDHILTFLEIMLVYINENSIKNNIETFYYAIERPFHAIISSSATKLAVGVANDKAVLGLQAAVLVAETYSDANIERVLSKTSKDEFGTEINDIVYIDLESMRAIKPTLEKIMLSDNKYDKVVIANSDEILVKTVIDAAEKYIERNRREKNMLEFNPIFRARNLSVDEKLVFCILPFDDDRLEIFNDIIRKELENDYQFTVIRSSDIFSNDEIMEDIWTYICKAHFIIADVSLRNPNVFYELGICHTVGKQVITICDEESLNSDYNGKLPFDIQSRRTIFYKNSGSGPQKMVSELKKHVQTILDKKTVI